MKLSAALEYENIRRNPADWNKIYLNHDGKFFHAYEWSAWLIKTVACTEEFQQQRGDAHVRVGRKRRGPARGLRREPAVVEALLRQGRPRRQFQQLQRRRGGDQRPHPAVRRP